MPETWPGTVRYKPRVDSPEIEPFRAPHKTDMEDGQARQRRSTTLNTASMAFEIPMDASEFAIFRAWVRDTLVDGTVPFTMPIWTGAGYANRTCSFVTPYRARPFGSGMMVSLRLDVEGW